MDGMWAVVNEPGGTAFPLAHPRGSTPAGKTGTAQVVGRDSGPARTAKGKYEDHAWFIGLRARCRTRRWSSSSSSRTAATASLGRGAARQAALRAALRQEDPSRDAAARSPPACVRAAERPMITRVLSARSRFDPIVLGSALALSALGILFVASATAGGKLAGLAARQGIWVAVGIGLMLRGGPLRLPRRCSRSPSRSTARASCRSSTCSSSASGSPTSSPGSGSAASSSSRPSSPRSRRRSCSPISSRTRTTGGCARGAFVKLAAIVGVPFLLVVLQPDLGPRPDVSAAARRRALLRRPAR